MIRAYLITERSSDAKILRMVLPESVLASVQLIESESDYGAESQAMSRLAEQRLPVVLVLNARTNDPMAIQQRYADLGGLLRSYGGPTPFKLAIAIPELEVIFFQNRDMVQTLIGKVLTDLEWQFAQKHPQEFLDSLGENETAFVEQMLQSLNEENLRAIRQHSLIQEITEFLSALAVASGSRS